MCHEMQPEVIDHLRADHPDVAYVVYSDSQSFLVHRSLKGVFRCQRQECGYATGDRDAFFVSVLFLVVDFERTLAYLCRPGSCVFFPLHKSPRCRTLDFSSSHPSSTARRAFVATT